MAEVEQHIKYTTFLENMRTILRNNLRKGDDFSVGTHTLRKTGYLFAVWGFLQTQEYRGGDAVPSKLLMVSCCIHYCLSKYV